jgi:hypothetical protein
VYVDSAEGKSIDVGPTSIRLNGSLRSGRVQLQHGYSVIATSDQNWREIPANVLNIDDLVDADPLYPYNHRYLVEGYNYTTGFSGERIYTGMDEYFGRLLQYIPPERFNALDGITVKEFGFFTVEEADGNLYFKIKVDKTDGSWRNEQFDVDWVTQADATSQIYVKAILSTSNVENTPVIEDFMVRVI